MAASYKEVTPAAGTYAAASAPDVDVSSKFEPSAIVVWSLSAAGVNAIYSFDGVNDHGLIMGGMLTPFVLRTRQTKIWVRKRDGAPVVAFSLMTDS